MQKATFIIHGKLRFQKKLKNKITKVFSDILDITFKETEQEFGAKKLTAQAIKKGAKIIIICGGDGSINEMVNGYFETKKDNNIFFGIIPKGTGNDFAKSLKISKKLEDLKQLIIQKKTIAVDVYNMDFTNLKQQKENRYFINISDIGIGGSVSEIIANSSKLLGSNLSYFKAIVTSFAKFKKQKVKLTSKIFNWEGAVMSLCMANGKYFGSGMCIAPEAELSNQKLQLTILGDISLLDYIKNLGNLKKGLKIKHPEVFYTQVESCKIESLEAKECPIDMDGEFIGFTPLQVDLAERKILFFGNK